MTNNAKKEPGLSDERRREILRSSPLGREVLKNADKGKGGTCPHCGKFVDGYQQ